MTFDPKKRDASWTMFQPGCWIDPAGRAHLFPDEVLAFMQAMHPEAGFDPNSKDDYDLVVDTFMRAIRDQGIKVVEFIRHERKDVA